MNIHGCSKYGGVIKCLMMQVTDAASDSELQAALEGSEWRFNFPDFSGIVTLSNRETWVRRVLTHFCILEHEGTWSQFKKGLETYEVSIVFILCYEMQN